MMKLLNLGCGNHFHEDWINLDYKSTGKGVIAHDLKTGIPFENNSFDAIYHSHVLEHFNKSDGFNFIKECSRVLKPNGIIRIAVPNLEEIVRNYLINLEKAILGDKMSEHNYNWMIIEMFDQLVRNYSGGEMANYLYQKNVPNEEFVYSRLGDEGKHIRSNFIGNQMQAFILVKKRNSFSLKKYFNINSYKQYIKRYFFAEELKYIQIAKFRASGEIHQWMYDRFSLKRLLSDNGFKDIIQVSYNSSKIPNWEKYSLDEKDMQVRKPDSLFMEGIKA